MNTVINQAKEQVQTPPVAPEMEREYVRPAVNIYERPEGYVLEAELPGVNKDGLAITLDGNLLTLEGRRTPFAPAETETLYRESNDADFRRVFEVDPNIDAGSISARLDQGVLTLKLPKKESAKPHKIPVA